MRVRRGGPRIAHELGSRAVCGADWEGEAYAVLIPFGSNAGRLNLLSSCHHTVDERRHNKRPHDQRRLGTYTGDRPEVYVNAMFAQPAGTYNGDGDLAGEDVLPATPRRNTDKILI